MSSIKRFLEEMGEGYYALPPEQQRATEIMAWISGILGIGLIAYTIYEHRQSKQRTKKFEEEMQHQRLEHEKKMAVLRQQMEQWQNTSREKMKVIVDRALNPSEADLEDIRAKLNDPNYVWEL